MLTKYLWHGKEVDLTGDNVAIKSNNFNVDKNGNMSCSNGSFKGTITSSTINLTDNGGASGANINCNSYAGESSLSSNWLQVKNSNGDYVAIQDGIEVVVTSMLGSSSAIYQDNILTTSSDGSFAKLVPGSGIVIGSKEEYKKNIRKLLNGINIIKNSEIYTFNLKKEKDTDKKHIGFVIGNKYKTPNEIIAKSNEGIDLYSTISIVWKAIQELIEENENLKQKIEILEAK